MAVGFCQQAELVLHSVQFEILVAEEFLYLCGQRLLKGLGSRPYAYFCHSYAAECGDRTVGIASHGDAFSAVVERGAVFGVQFHPEKSGAVGLAVLRNFLRICGEAR